MEDTSAVHDVRRSSGGAEPAAPRDLRDWLVRTEAIGQITRIREPIDYIKQFSRRTKLPVRLRVAGRTLVGAGLHGRAPALVGA